MAEDRGLGARAGAVFDRFLNGQAAGLHPADRLEAGAFWQWLGEFERPADVKPRARHWQRWAVAAGLLFATHSSTAWLNEQPPERALAQQFVTGHAERRTARLEDGSIITIAPDSRVEVSYVPTTRYIRLTAGEALFEVAHNPDRPFVVSTPHGEVRAVGTAFDVTIADQEAEVTVIEGVIRVALRPDPPDAGAGEPIEKLASKGERVAFGVTSRHGSSTAFIRQVDGIDPVSATAWTRGKLVFHGEPLRTVVAKINLYSRGRVTLTDPAAGSIPVYGVVDQGDTEAIHELIANPHAVSIERDPD